MSVMSIEKIVEQALQDGYLTPVMEAEVGRICDNASELSIEELVLTEAIARVAEIEATSENSLDVGDIAAYALNRLPPLYATTEEGANYQRLRAKAELQELISQQISESIGRNLNQPNDNRTPVSGKTTGNEVLRQVSNLLQVYAPSFEQK
jgi:hypothetical protein